MGLDMFLGKRLKETESVAYWRKANAIHLWFVENIQGGEDDCKEYEVSRDDIELLKTACEQVLKDKSQAEEILPTVAGFFFGTTDYDESYFEDVEYTLNICNEILNNFDFETYDLWYSSWW